jgi:hypothetical protein
MALRRAGNQGLKLVAPLAQAARHPQQQVALQLAQAVVAVAVGQRNQPTAVLAVLAYSQRAAAAAAVLHARASWVALVALVVLDIARFTHGKLWLG